MSHNDVSNDVSTNPDVSYEAKDLNVRAIAYFGLGLLAVTIAAMVLIWLFMSSMDNRSPDNVGDAPAELVMPPEPRLQPNPVDQMASPEEQLQKLTAEQEIILSTYGWVDREAGIAHIPIDEAMTLTVAKYR